MSNSYVKPVKLQTLSARELLHVCYDSAGQLVLVQTDNLTSTFSQFSTHSIRNLTVQEQAHLKAAFYWLNIYEPEPDGSNLEQVRGYLEAFHHLCEISAWQAASSILLSPTKANPAKELGEQLASWGYYSELIELCRQLLGKVNFDLDCRCLRGLGVAYAYLGQTQKAINYHDRNLELARKIGNKLSEIHALSGLGGAYYSLEQYKTALNCFKQQLTVAREINDRKEEGYALVFLGTDDILRGNYRRGVKYCQEALAIARSLANLEMEGHILGYLGGTHIQRRRYQQAIAYLQQQLEISNKLGDRCQKYSALYYLGSSYFLLGQAQSAIECLSQSLKFYHETGSKSAEAATAIALGGVYSSCLKQYQDALEYYKQALTITREIGKRSTEIGAMSNLSYCYGCMGQHQLAIEYAEQSFAIACEIKNRQEKGMALACLANTYWYQKQYFRALRLVLQSMLVLPPWASLHGYLIFSKVIQEITSARRQNAEGSRAEGIRIFIFSLWAIAREGLS